MGGDDASKEKVPRREKKGGKGRESETNPVTTVVRGILCSSPLPDQQNLQEDSKSVFILTIQSNLSIKWVEPALLPLLIVVLGAVQ